MRLFLVLLVLIATVAAADRRALSVDVAGSWNGGAVPAPMAANPKSTLGFGPAIWLGARYGLSHHLEATATGFFETPTTMFHNGLTLRSGGSDFVGTLQHSTTRFGGLVGARYVFGLVWRVHVGLEVGLSQRLNTQLLMIDDRDPSAPVDYGLMLPNASQTQFAISPVLGLEWQAGDHFSFAVLPRAQILVGGALSWAVIVPLQFSWSWFL
ncbi:MAG: hypothetical protein Q8L14_22230 [Myxococcales bacterium]|nr:hypothetical protein [Myxococcales bacterium]